MHIPAVPYRKHFIEKEISVFYELFLCCFDVVLRVWLYVFGVHKQVRLGLPLKYV